MKKLSLGLLLLVFAAEPASAQPACDLQGIKTLGELQGILSRRAVEAVGRAALPSAANEARLRQLVAPSATFATGGGDVGRPLGTGVDGLRALARDMKADSYRFFAWSSFPTPVEDACTPQKVQIEFTDAAGESAYPITFTFEAGWIVAAVGWRQSLVTGPIQPIRD